VKIAYLMQHEAEIERLAPPDVQWVKLSTRPDRTWDPRELVKLKDVDAIMVWSEPVTEEVIAAAPNLKIVQRFGAGYDVLRPAFEVTRRRGIPCCNVEGVNKETVAEHGMLLILALARRLLEMHDHTLHARWPRQLRPDNPVFELAGKTLGIIGLGHTGSELGKRARAFRLNILYNDVREIDPELVRSLEARSVPKEELLRSSDIVSINTDLNPTTRGMISARELAWMKPTAILVCCARGGIIDEPALRDALNAGRLAGAGIDVFSPEPIRPDNPLLKAKNVVLTPHVAGVTGESISRSYQWAHENVRRVVEQDLQPRWIVNGL
jgi:phosphoglycerate dehydrogenase-like enzyme